MDKQTNQNLQKIYKLRLETQKLIHNLYDAARDKDTFESALQPIDQIPLDVDDMETVSIKNHYPSITPLQSPIKQSKSPKPKNSTKPIRIKLNDKHESLIKNQQNFKTLDLLNQNPEFYKELKDFRKLYPEKFKGYVPTQKRIPKGIMFKQNEPTPTIQKLNSQPEMDDLHYFNGYVQVNKKLEFEKFRHPFQTILDLESFTDSQNIDYLCETEPPVKVSIPNGTIRPSKKSYVPHRRLSFDATDSVNIGDFLHKGFEPVLWSGKGNRHNSHTVSLEHECVLHLRNRQLG
ncbi:hypothetical protein BC833DRAFT_182951 [Globomyces pollinis-pini]|nr:hypothetical protein BC833DRAFT_182951 [Globomyces pollinis-pini]